MNRVIPVPRWFFNEILSRSRDEAMVMQYFMEKALLGKNDEVHASYMDIENGTGLFPQAISKSIKDLCILGCLTRVSAGVVGGKDGAPKKAHYRLNWDFRGGDVGKQVRKIYGSNGAVPENLAKVEDLIKKGESVRMGRFGPVEKGEAWFTSGMGAVKERLKESTVSGIAMSKFNSGNIEGMNHLDFFGYFQDRYLKKFGAHYPATEDQGWIKRTFNFLIKRLGKPGTIKVIDWFVGIQVLWKHPTIPMLGSSKYFMAIIEGAKAYYESTEG